MFFVYLKDGRRLEIPDASSVIHRTMVVFLDKGDQIIRQLPADDILAYSRTPYEGDVIELFEPRTEPRPVTVLDSELLMRPRHHRRLKPVPSPEKPDRASRVRRLRG